MEPLINIETGQVHPWGGIRENCRVLPDPHMRTHVTNLLEQPDLASALRNIDQFAAWVSAVLIPVASQWIEEHRDEVIAQLKGQSLNDMGAAMAVAAKLVKERQKIDRPQFNPDQVTYNETWVAENKRRLASEYTEG